MKFPVRSKSHKVKTMHRATINAFMDELSSIEKEAGVREALKAGTRALKSGSEKYTRAGQKTAIKADNVLDTVRKRLGRRVPSVPTLIRSATTIATQ